MSFNLETNRLRLRDAAAGDAGFFLSLMNEPHWRRFIRDHDVTTPEAAADYIRENISAMYRVHGLGLKVMERKDSGTVIGICGLLQRETLPDVDLGFALLSEYWGRGYVREAAAAVLEMGARDLGLRRILALTHPDNHRSIRVLERLGFIFQSMHGQELTTRLYLYTVDEPDPVPAAGFG